MEWIRKKMDQFSWLIPKFGISKIYVAQSVNNRGPLNLQHWSQGLKNMYVLDKYLFSNRFVGEKKKKTNMLHQTVL